MTDRKPLTEHSPNLSVAQVPDVFLKRMRRSYKRWMSATTSWPRSRRRRGYGQFDHQWGTRS